MSRKKLSPDDLEVWGRLAQTAVPMHPKRKRAVDALRLSNPVKQPSPGNAPIAAFEIGHKASTTLPTHDLSGDIRHHVAKAPVRMDRKAHSQMKRGKLKPEGKIDLHGLTLDQAHPRLTSFIMRSYASGKRLVLVVTGKGKPRDDGGPIPVRLGVLRHQVPHWLQTPPLAQVVLQISEAHLKHGGGGAYYVYLRRQR